jgi:hypothetical protein
MAADGIRDIDVNKPVVYLLRDSAGVWSVTVGTNHGIEPIVYTVEWKTALTRAIDRARAEQAALLLVDPDGHAHWITTNTELDDLARRWDIV